MLHSPHLLVDQAGHVVTITLNRPEKRNALNSAVIAELHDLFTRLQAQTAPLSEGSTEPDVRAVVLTGSGDKAFGAGADIDQMSHMTPAQAKRFTQEGQGLCALMESLSFPIVAAVFGFALGAGCELALACDFIYASDKATFGFPEINLGVIPGFGGTQRLARRVGITRAREMIYTGAWVNAQRAYALGLVNEVVAGEDLLLKAREVAEKIASKGPIAVASAKRVLLRGANPDLQAATELESQAFGLLFGTADQREGMTAFLEKRPAQFRGR